MNITEIFYSIQGESTYAGLPCVFIRTSGCNLSCSYCDTDYANSESTEYSIEKIIKTINTFAHTHLVEITGGEPMLQPDIYDLFKELKKNDFDILLETNGSINLKSVPEYVCKIIDIKTPSSTHKDSFHPDNLKYFNPNKDNIKFVIGNTEDYDWMRDFLNKNQLFGYNILASTVFSKIEPKIIVKKILEDGLNIRFQLQLHKYIWDANSRGV